MMPARLESKDISKLCLVKSNPETDEIELVKDFDKPSISLEVNDLLFFTISSDFDYIYKINSTNSSYRGHTTFFVFKVNSNSTSNYQNYLILKINENVSYEFLDNFMSCLINFTDLLDLESASFKNGTLKKIFNHYKKNDICDFDRNESSRDDVMNSLNFHNQVYVDKDKAEMIKKGGEVLNTGIVSLAKLTSNVIDAIGKQINDYQTTTEEVKVHKKSHDRKRPHRKNRHKKNYDEESESDSDEDSNEEQNLDDNERSRHKRSHRHRRSRRAQNLKKLNYLTKNISQTAQMAASAIQTAISETASYVVPVVEDKLPKVISSLSNCDEETSKKIVGSTLGYGSVTLQALNEIKNGFSESINIVGSSVANQTTNIVKNKYGPEAAEETSEVLESVGNATTAYMNVKSCKKII